MADLRFGRLATVIPDSMPHYLRYRLYLQCAVEGRAGLLESICMRQENVVFLNDIANY